MSSLLFDLRLIVRGFWRRPGFAIAATVPLALAMGARPGHLFRSIASGLSVESSLLGWQKPLIAAATAIAIGSGDGGGPSSS